MKFLITGGCGFLGSNLAEEVLERGDELVVFDNLSRVGSEVNLAHLKTLGTFEHINGDIRNTNDVNRVIAQVKPDVLFHLAGQVAMTTSISDPRKDFEINVLGTFNVLEAIRQSSPDTLVIYSSTNKVYGDLEWVNFLEETTRYSPENYPKGFDEQTLIDFHSPYGCSKGAADQYMLDYARMFGLKTVVFRHSSIFGINQHSTYDQGWVGWFVQKALEEKAGTRKEPFTISGSGKQVRDILFSEDLKKCYFSVLDHQEACIGEAFNIGGGMKNSLSLLELFNFLESHLAVTMNYKKLPWRESDQKVFVADHSKITSITGWKPLIETPQALATMVEWVLISG